MIKKILKKFTDKTSLKEAKDELSDLYNMAIGSHEYNDLQGFERQNFNEAYKAINNLLKDLQKINID